MVFIYRSGDHGDLNVLTHSFPTPRYSDLVSTRSPAPTPAAATPMPGPTSFQRACPRGGASHPLRPSGAAKPGFGAVMIKPLRRRDVGAAWLQQEDAI